MRYTITGRNIDVTPGLRAAIEEKIETVRAELKEKAMEAIVEYLSVPRSSVVKSVTGSAPSSSRTTWISHRPVFSITSLTYPTVSAFSLDRSPGSPRPHVLLRGGRSVHRFSLSVFISALHSV